MAAAVGEYLPPLGLVGRDTRLASMATTMHWSPNFSAASLTKARRDTAAVLIETLSAPEVSKRANVVDGTHAAADRKRHETGLGGAPHHIEHDAAVLMARGDVEEGEFVGAGPVIGDSRRDGIASVAQIDEIDAFDDAAVFDVEAGNDADLEHGLRVLPQAAVAAERINFNASAASSRPS